MLLIFDAVVLAYGFYTIYSAISMKRTKDLSNWLVGAETAASIRDKEGYISFIFPKIILMGAMAVVFGAVSLVNDCVTPITLVMQVMVLVFLAICVLLFVTVRKAKKKVW